VQLVKKQSPVKETDCEMEIDSNEEEWKQQLLIILRLSGIERKTSE
jgi:hypothetical protein